VVRKGIDEALQMEEKTGEVRHGPKRGGWRWRGGAHRGWGRSGGEARITTRGNSDSSTDMDGRSREGEGCLRRALKGEWGWPGGMGGGGSGLHPFLNGAAAGQGREKGGRWRSATHSEGDVGWV
jgi:hypothetical protein